MKLEVGKYYKRRDGYKEQIVYYNHSDNKYLGVNTTNHLHNWYPKNGQFILQGDDEVHGGDLISEWVEPVEHEVDVCFIYDHLNKCIIPKQAGYEVGPFETYITETKVKVKFTEGQGL